MKVLIVGAGAIGRWLATLLCERAKVQVSLLARPQQMDDLLPHLAPLERLDRLEPGRAYDDIIFAVKAFQVEQAAQQVVAAGLKLKRIWGFQNGVGSDEALARAFPGHWFAALTATVPVLLEGNQVCPGSRGGLAWATKHESLLAPEWLHHLGWPCQAVGRIDSLKCSKLLLNLTCNASCALLDLLPAQVVAHRQLFAFELACLREYLRVVEANGIPLVDLPGYSVSQMVWLRHFPDWLVKRFVAGKITRARGLKPPSLLLDLRARRPQSEVEVLNGAVVALGEKVSLATPGNRWLHHNLARVVAQPELWPEYRNQPDQVARQALASLTAKSPR